MRNGVWVAHGSVIDNWTCVRIQLSYQGIEPMQQQESRLYAQPLQDRQRQACPASTLAGGKGTVAGRRQDLQGMQEAMEAILRLGALADDALPMGQEHPEARA